MHANRARNRTARATVDTHASKCLPARNTGPRTTLTGVGVGLGGFATRSSADHDRELLRFGVVGWLVDVALLDLRPADQLRASPAAAASSVRQRVVDRRRGEVGRSRLRSRARVSVGHTPARRRVLHLRSPVRVSGVALRTSTSYGGVDDRRDGRQAAWRSAWESGTARCGPRPGACRRCRRRRARSSRRPPTGSTTQPRMRGFSARWAPTRPASAGRSSKRSRGKVVLGTPRCYPAALRVRVTAHVDGARSPVRQRRRRARGAPAAGHRGCGAAA